jgi:hypothetical protein
MYIHAHGLYICSVKTVYHPAHDLPGSHLVTTLVDVVDAPLLYGVQRQPYSAYFVMLYAYLYYGFDTLQGCKL